MIGAFQTSPSSIVWSVEVSAEGVYRDTVLKVALRLSLARDEREKPQRCIEAETVAWSSKQLFKATLPSTSLMQVQRGTAVLA